MVIKFESSRYKFILSASSSVLYENLSYSLISFKILPFCQYWKMPRLHAAPPFRFRFLFSLLFGGNQWPLNTSYAKECLELLYTVRSLSTRNICNFWYNQRLAVIHARWSRKYTLLIQHVCEKCLHGPFHSYAVAIPCFSLQTSATPYLCYSRCLL